MALAGLVSGMASAACAGPTWGHPDVPGRLVGVQVVVGGASTPLYPDPKGTGRFYLEAREGAGYEVHLTNRTRERLGVVVTVDGLNVVSGERDAEKGRMYILDPWGSTTIRGWRRSLRDVHRFTFVDEKASYASRTGKASGRMGWIEVSVYRERPRPPRCCGYDERGAVDSGKRESDPSGRSAEARRDAAEAAADAPATSTAPPPPASAAPEPYAESGAKARAEAALADEAEEGVASGALRSPAAPSRPRSFPGTGWGSRMNDPVVVVSFDAEPSPAERLTLRYEYASTLRALGIRPWPEVGRDRLRERERGEGGFAEPPTR